MNEGKRERGRERKKTIREKEEYTRRKQRGSVKYIKEEIQIYIIQVEEKRHIYIFSLSAHQTIQNKNVCLSLFNRK